MKSKPYIKLHPPYSCPWCGLVTVSNAKEHREHLAEHEREEMKGRNCYMNNLEKLYLERDR